MDEPALSPGGSCEPWCSADRRHRGAQSDAAGGAERRPPTQPPPLVRRGRWPAHEPQPGMDDSVRCGDRLVAVRLKHLGQVLGETADPHDELDERVNVGGRAAVVTGLHDDAFEFER